VAAAGRRRKASGPAPLPRSAANLTGTVGVCEVIALKRYLFTRKLVGLVNHDQLLANLKLRANDCLPGTFDLILNPLAGCAEPVAEMMLLAQKMLTANDTIWPK
jgi:hypothetical protein